MLRGKVVDRKRGCSDPPAGVCEVIRARTRNRLGKATGKSRSESHYGQRTGSHDGLGKAVGLHITPRLGEPQPGKAAAISLTAVVQQEGSPTSPLLSSSKAETQLSLIILETPKLVFLQVQFHERTENARFRLSG